jgi:hypothetical protein
MSIRIGRYRALVSRSKPLRIEDTLSFVEDGEFLREFRECGLSDDDLESIQAAITVCPTGGDVVPVSHNIRDMFYCVDDSSTVVIRYVYLESANTVLLLTAYNGDDILPMTAAEADEAEGYVERQIVFFTSRHTR